MRRATFRRLFGRECSHGFAQNAELVGVGDLEDTRRRFEISQKKLHLAKKYLNFLRLVPWVKFVGVSGSVSFGSACEEDDIDVFIVAAEDRIWLVRLIEQLVLRLRGVRRRFGSKDVTDKICINYYVSESNLQFRPKSYFTALEIAMLNPVVHGDFYKVILSQNPWIAEFFSGIEIPKVEHRHGRSFPLFTLLDRLARFAQLQYMKIRNHPVEGCVLERDEIRFFDPEVWKVREKKLKKALEPYNL